MQKPFYNWLIVYIFTEHDETSTGRQQRSRIRGNEENVIQPVQTVHVRRSGQRHPRSDEHEFGKIGRFFHPRSKSTLHMIRER